MYNLFIFNETSRAAVYGIGTYVNELVNSLKMIDYLNINVVTIRDNNPEFELKETDGIKYWRIPLSKYLINKQQYNVYYKNVVAILKKYVGDTENMIVHINYLQCFSLLENLKQVFNCKIITTVHYMNWCFDLQGNRLRLKKLLERKDLTETEAATLTIFESETKLLQNSDAIICLSDYTLGILCNESEVPANKIKVIYNGLQDCTIDNVDKNKIKERYYLNTGEKIILFAGRLDIAKGVDILIKAYQKVLEHIPNSRLVIAGEGNFKEYLSIADNIWAKITFTGRIDREKLFDFYSIADVGVMPSTHEQCSYTAIEMMMHGIPIVATKTTGLTEMIDNNGIKIPVTELEDNVEIPFELIAEGIIKILTNNELLKDLSVKSRQRYCDYYTSELMKQNTLNYYQEIITQL